MNNDDTQLLQLIKNLKNGDKSVCEDISSLINNEVYNLVSFVYKKEETRNKLARHVIVKLIHAIDEFDEETMDIHMWIARFATLEIYNVYSKQNGNIFGNSSDNLSYEYNSIDEDAEFADCAADYNRAFIDTAELKKINAKLSSLSKGQKIIYEMFCYECFSIDEIEDVLGVDSTYIIDAIAGMKEKLCAKPAQKSSDVIEIEDVGYEEIVKKRTAYENIQEDTYNNEIEAKEEEHTVRFNSSGLHHILSKFSQKSVVSIICCAVVVLLTIVVLVVVSIKGKNETSDVANTNAISVQNKTTEKQDTKTAAPTKKNDAKTTTQENSSEAPTTEKNTPAQQKETPKNNGNNGNNIAPSVNRPVSPPAEEPNQTSETEEPSTSEGEPITQEEPTTPEESSAPEEPTTPKESSAPEEPTTPEESSTPEEESSTPEDEKSTTPEEKTLQKSTENER